VKLKPLESAETPRFQRTYAFQEKSRFNRATISPQDCPTAKQRLTHNRAEQRFKT
jgi:hypothetical protein